MNVPVNRSSESPQTPYQPDTVGESLTIRQPIPLPNHPRQYRAIGLVYGQYQPSEEQLTRGNIITAEGTSIESVLLGKIISLVKNHLDLERSHLWVVYPRTRGEEDNLHLQIAGVWEPQILNQDRTGVLYSSPVDYQTGDFSVRGEVAFVVPEQETVVVKVRQGAKKQGEKAKFFKVKLKGTLPSRPLGNFWDFQIQLRGDCLYILQGLNLGPAQKKKSGDGRGNFKSQSRPGSSPRNPSPRPFKSRPLT
ncbi:MAG: hypothetical protein N5P05_001003 [Chroococcopsis gigantea SAG 12.99]|jgi:hypothetical protein|nr:hypothetical protein [Chlorogloea purpurea SAG 13.99]MDV2999397.1 hypothetical protein [Chroococcopsis gigantea SAG 12.99]